MKLSESVHVIFTPRNVRRLKDFHIETLMHFLGKDPERLARILHISYSQTVQVVDEIFRAFVGFPSTCLELYQRRVQAEHSIATGCSHLDRLIGGHGLKSGYVYLLFGPPATGKTQLCLSLTVSCLITPLNAEMDSQVRYIDTKNDLSPERVLEILQARSPTVSSVSILSRVIVYKCFKPETLLNAMENVVKETSLKTNKTKLLVVDNLASPLLSLLSQDIGLAYSYAAQLSQLMHQVAASNVCVICINHSRTVDGEIQPALGSLWSNLDDIRMKIERDPSASDRLTLERVQMQGRSSNSTSCSLVIGSKGLEHARSD